MQRAAAGSIRARPLADAIRDTVARMVRRSHSLALATLILIAACGPAPSAVPSASGTPAPPSPTDSATGETSPPANATPGTLTLTTLVGGLESPVDVAIRPSDPSATYVVEQLGRIVVVRDSAVRAVPFLDITERVIAAGERGMLGLTFHPDPDDDRLFVSYTDQRADQVVASFRAPSDPDAAVDPATEQILLVMDDPFPNHNGGGLAFGPDGYLYISTGDGGGAGDPLGSGRDLGSLLGKVLRIDIDAGADGDRAYGIPADNPYVADPAARPETWLSGLRNPWRIRFDRATGDLWIGDVGQGDWEEVDVARAGVGGLDFGWNVMEGTHCFVPASGCDPTGLAPPITEYGHDLGCSITGGTVYRGSAWPALAGSYLFSDYCSGRFWSVPADAVGTVEPVLLLESGRSISSIAEDGAGELVATDLAAGELLRISAPGR